MAKVFAGFLLGVLALPLALICVARLGMLPVNSNTLPSRWESAFAHMALDAAAAHHAPQIPNPIAPTEENLMAGVRLFKNDCSGCHGTPNSAADTEEGIHLYTPAPQV